MKSTNPPDFDSRRNVLKVLSLTALGAGTVSMGPSSTAFAAPIPSNGACLLTPQSVEGPYYFDPKLERSEITEGHKGIPVKLKLQVLGADCHALPNTRVDIWHADAQGLYSGYDRQGDSGNISTKGQTFLRGTQFANSAGEVLFTTIYPGWYPGRTAHIHFKIFLDKKTALTAQIYFPDALNEFIYANVPAYKRNHQRDTINATDLFALEATSAAFAGVKEENDHYLVSLLVGVDPSAHPGMNPMPGGTPPDSLNGPGEFRRLPPGPPPGGSGEFPYRRQMTDEERLRALVPEPLMK
jgi:protocatechuate 3,4-dioxygenase beta subunit